MKLTTLALASAFALSGTFAFAHANPNHHRSGVRIHHGAVGMGYAQTYRGSMNYGGYPGGSMNYGGYDGGPNNRGGLVGGDDSGTYKP
jgi:uncharacterized membrane protein